MALLRSAAGRPPRFRSFVVGLPENESQAADKALRYFHATCLSEATGPARNTITSAAQCRCCSHVIAQRFERIGSTLFYDDDPRTSSKRSTRPTAMLAR